MNINLLIRKIPKIREGIHIENGDAMRNQGNWIAACDHYKRALNKNPENQPIWIQFGHALKESNQLRLAEEAYLRAVALKPYDAEAQLQLGHCQKVQGNLQGAVKSYLSAYKLDPNDESILQELNHLGWTSNELKIPNKAHSVKNAASKNEYSNHDSKLRSIPKNYSDTFTDVAKIVEMGILSSPEQHYEIYGRKQGRSILATFARTKPSDAFVLCPSFFKRCGIGEHSRYLADTIEASGLTTHRIRSTRDLKKFNNSQIKDAVIIVNHGPGLFDGYNPQLSEGESTVDLLSTLGRYFEDYNLRPIIFMHSLLDRDNTVMFPRQQMALEYPIPIVTTIEAAARTFNIARVEHGMQPLPLPNAPKKSIDCRDQPTIGFFGFFQWGGKNFDALFNAAQNIKAKLVGSVATSNESQVKSLEGLLKERGIQCDLGTGWVEDSQLADRLNEADYYYLPQHDYDHWNNSGTARFVMNFGHPVIVPPHNPFLDLRSYAIFADDDDLPQIMAHLRDPEEYQAACGRTISYAQTHPMTHEMPSLANSPHLLSAEDGVDNFLDANSLCKFTLLSLPLAHLRARISHFNQSTAERLSTPPFSAERLEEIQNIRKVADGITHNDKLITPNLQYWRNHYDIMELIHENPIDFIYAAFRSIAKKEPDLHDIIRISSFEKNMKHDDTKDMIATYLRVIVHLLDRGHDLEFADQVKIYHDGRPIDRSDLIEENTIYDISSKWINIINILQKSSNLKKYFKTNAGYANISDLVVFEKDLLAACLADLSNRKGYSIDFKPVDSAIDPMSRFIAIADCMANAGMKMTDLFVIDAPTVNPIDAARKSYGLGEFWSLEGDYFLFQAIQCLLKREPLAAEVHHLDGLMQNSGRIGVLRHLLAHPACQADIIGIDHPNTDRLDSDAKAVATIGCEFRSVHAGGWDQRNAYLEAKRNAGRLWNRIQRQRDRFWSQAGQNLQSIDSVVSTLTY